MKTRNLMMAAVILLAGSITMKSVAQENIKSLIKKCENMDVIDANIVRNKKPNANSTSLTHFSTLTSSKTNANSLPIFTFNSVRDPSANPFTNTRTLSAQAPRSIVNLTLKYTPELEKELVAAFRKDQDNAIREVEQKKEGKVTHMLYQFDDSEYSFTIKNDTISIQATEGNPVMVVLKQKKYENMESRLKELQNFSINTDSLRLKELESVISRLTKDLQNFRNSPSDE